MEREEHMKRDLILSIIIGVMATYLPVDRYPCPGYRRGCNCYRSILYFVGNRKSPRSGNSLRGLENISQGYCKPEKEKKQ